MKKKISLIIAAAALTTLMIVGGTLAWFTDSDKATNVITMGNVDVELTEEGWKNPINVVPGAKINKNPVVTNTGNNPAYIRAEVKVTVTGTEINAAIADEVYGLLTKGTGWDREGNYFYYLGILDPNGNTGVIFNEFKLPTKWDNKYANAQIKIDIAVSAIQSENVVTVDASGVTVANVKAAFGEYDSQVTPTPVAPVIP